MLSIYSLFTISFKRQMNTLSTASQLLTVCIVRTAVRNNNCPSWKNSGGSRRNLCGFFVSSLSAHSVCDTIVEPAGQTQSRNTPPQLFPTAPSVPPPKFPATRPAPASRRRVRPLIPVSPAARVRPRRKLREFRPTRTQ